MHEFRAIPYVILYTFACTPVILQAWAGGGFDGKNVGREGFALGCICGPAEVAVLVLIDAQC